MSYRISLWCFSLAVLFSCVAYADALVITRGLQQSPSLSYFEFCHDGGCAKVNRVTLTHEEWQQAARIFDPQPKNPEEERYCIASAIGILEKIIGSKTGTDTDRAGTFGNSAIPGQLDCNDEATNSTTYIKLMQQAGLIRFHEIRDTKNRNFFINGWPHTTAVIREKQIDHAIEKAYAVDSWFYDNGKPAVIIPLELWKSGWKPDNTEAH